MKDKESQEGTKGTKIKQSVGLFNNGRFGFEPLSYEVIGCAFEVHRTLGPGLLESAYQEALAYELKKAGLLFQEQLGLPLKYKDADLGIRYRLDLVVENQLLVELKSVEELLPVHAAQVITYLKISGLKVGLLINFNAVNLKNGIRRLVN